MSKIDLIPEVSLVIPMYRESAQVSATVTAIQAQLAGACSEYEIILVDDGSADDTWSYVVKEAQSSPFVRGIRLSRNFGKEHAVAAGLEASRGRAVIVMDGDLQHPPTLLPEMIAAWREGKGQIVEGVKSDRGREPLLYRMFAASFYGILKKLSGFDLRGASDYKLLDRKVVDAWLRLRERNLFFRGMTAWLGYPRHQIAFKVEPRVGGKSRWSVFALVRLAFTAVTGFSSVLLHLVTFFGIVFLIFAMILGAYTLSYWATGRAVTGFTTVILLLLIIGSLLMVSLGVIGLYLARIYDEVKARPRYLVSENIGFSADVETTMETRAQATPQSDQKS